MKHWILAFLLSSGAALAGESCEHIATGFSCVRYLGNYDGDTITFHIPGVHAFFGKKAKIRVKGIDTPELKPKGRGAPCELEWGRVAQNLVEAELKRAKRIDLVELDGFDKYGRILAQVRYDGKSLSEVLLRNHLAVPYEGKKKKTVNWCEHKQKREKK